MADLSQNEKRAAGWRKLKKYQQHKTSSNAIKSNKKNHPTSNEQNGEPYSFFKGFADPQTNTNSNHSPVQVLESKDLHTSHYSASELLIVDSTNESSSGVDVHLPLMSSNEMSMPPLPLPTDAKSTEQSIPISSDIFSNSYSSVKSNFSDFFDNIKSSPDYDSVKGNSSMNQMHPSTNICPVEEYQISSKPCKSDLKVSDDKTNDCFEVDISEKKIDTLQSTKNLDTDVSNVICTKIDDVQSVNSQTHLVSSAENLRQLSLELSGLIDSSVTSSDTHSTQMEQRNQELAALYASEKEKCEKLKMQMVEMESQISNLRAELFQHQTDTQVKFQQELSPIQEQLQLHVQTVGILVGEKTELEAALSKSQQTAKQKAVEVEELQGRLKASRHRVSELEREVSSVNLSAKQMESTVQQQSKDLLRLKLEKEMITKQLEESDEEASELRQNLDVQSAEVLKLQQELQEKISQLDLAQLRVQQLSLSDSTDVEKQLESLHQQKVGLERQVAELQQSIKTVATERDQANNQYQEYIHHVNSHLKNMADKLAAATAENEQLTNREQSLVKHLSELEKQLQQQQQQQQQRNRVKDSPLHGKEAERLLQLEKSFTEIQDEKEKIAADLDCQIQENKSLKDQLEMYSSQVEKLEVMIENFKADQPDSRKLLEAMESDKVAAARAVEQNQKLKTQLEELQEGFIQMTNNKLDLTEELEKEQLLSKELAERLAQQELEISELRTQLTENKMRIENLPNDMDEGNENNKTQIYTMQALENEINQYKKQCQSLQTENDDLKMKLTHNGVIDTIEDDNQKDNIIESLKANVNQLTMERDQLLLKLSDSKPPTVHKATDSPDSSFINEEVNITDYSNLKESMEKLQDRFTKTMEEVAELSDEKQRLEHLVLQLQGETETIGEYIALYQKQRSMLRQRAQEKDEQLARLARDREEVKIKLNELNKLIGQLVAENGLKGTNLNVASSEIPTGVQESNDEVISYAQGLTNGDVSSKNILDSAKDSEVQLESNSQVKPDKTADKIIALLSEIETSTLVEPRNVESFHPCPWCSGRLITV